MSSWVMGGPLPDPSLVGIQLFCFIFSLVNLHTCSFQQSFHYCVLTSSSCDSSSHSLETDTASTVPSKVGDYIVDRLATRRTLLLKLDALIKKTGEASQDGWKANRIVPPYDPITVPEGSAPTAFINAVLNEAGIQHVKITQAEFPDATVVINGNELTLSGWTDFWFKLSGPTTSSTQVSCPRD